MQAVILAGGLGTRLGEESVNCPKPMLEIGGWPILWHIMKIYEFHGIRDFILSVAYKGYIIKEFFANYHLHASDLTIDIEDGHAKIHRRHAESWKVTIVDTGTAKTGGSLLPLKPYLGNQTFMLSYGDAVTDLNIGEMIGFHLRHGKLATMAVVQVPSRFGVARLAPNDPTGQVEHFGEKLTDPKEWINGGFFILEPKALDYIAAPETVWEREPLERLTADGQLLAYRHSGYWSCLDTLRDKRLLDAAWASGNPPWKKW